jgi:L-seryl-tRNA(Ser) seleniumtransferase
MKHLCQHRHRQSDARELKATGAAQTANYRTALMDLPKTAPTDRFGNPLDPIVGYARGVILKGTQEEVERMLRARHIVGERVRTKGKESVYDLSGMNRGSGITADDVPHLTSHVPFFERFEGQTEPYALKHMGADPARNRALIINRVSAANFVALSTLLAGGDRVFALAPAGGSTHPSAVRPISMVGAAFHQFHAIADLERAWQTQGPPRLLLITPISASKRHIALADVQRALGLPRAANTLVYVDDAHMASRIGYFREPRTFELGNVDLGVCSADKHVAGPRAGILVGRADLVTEISSRVYELGFDAQAGQYVGVANALRNFDPDVIRKAGDLAEQLLRILQARYGDKAYLGGPGVSLSGDDVLEIARAEANKGKPKLVAVEAAGVVAMEMLAQDGILTIGAVSMPSSAPVVRLMMYPDGHRLGVGPIADSLHRAIARLGEVLDDVEAARDRLLGSPPRLSKIPPAATKPHGVVRAH